jgi:hypothetical protein
LVGTNKDRPCWFAELFDGGRYKAVGLFAKPSSKLAALASKRAVVRPGTGGFDGGIDASALPARRRHLRRKPDDWVGVGRAKHINLRHAIPRNNRFA